MGTPGLSLIFQVDGELKKVARGQKKSGEWGGGGEGGGVKGLGKYKNISLDFALKHTYDTLLIIFILLKFKSPLES